MSVNQSRKSGLCASDRVVDSSGAAVVVLALTDDRQAAGYERRPASLVIVPVRRQSRSTDVVS